MWCPIVFLILNKSKEQLEFWKIEIDRFSRDKLKLELHSQKSKIISLSRGVDFVGFRNFWCYRLLRRRNITKMLSIVKKYKSREISKEKLIEIFQGWNAYAKWADSYNLRKDICSKIYKLKK